MTFNIGDTVVHPQYGVGTIVTLEDKEFAAGGVRKYYEVSIQNGSTVWVPVKRTTSGLRRLGTRAEIAACRVILASRPSALPDDARIRQAELTAHLNRGTIAAHCEVLRDLAAFGEHRSMIGNLGAFLQVILDVLSAEWAFVEGTTRPQAMYEIQALLERGREAQRAAAAAKSPQPESEPVSDS